MPTHLMRSAFQIYSAVWEASLSRSNVKSETIRRKPSKKKFSKKFEIMEGSGSPQDQSIVLSRVLKQLWPKQKDAASFTLKRKKNFLAMETGTGKTLTTLASLQSRHVRGSVDLAVIVCPATAVHVWEREFHQWLKGTTLRLAVVSLDMARFYFKYLRKEQVDAIIFDEVHRLKNPNSAQSRRCGIIARTIPIRYGLTGTDIEDTVIDLFAQYRAVNPEPLGDNWVEFRESFCRRSGYMGLKWVISDKKKKEVLTLIEPVTYRLTKAEAFPKRKLLPPVHIYAQLKGTQKKLYEQLEKNMVAKVGEFKISSKRAITQMLRLQQITGGHCPADNGDMLTFECGKADALVEFLQSWDRKKKLVIFARYIHELELIKKICERAKYSAEIYTPKRPDLEDRFQKEAHPQVFIGQIDRGGIALTLLRSSTPIFFSKTFSSITYRQALGRVDRGGQTEPVSPIFLTTQGTIDEDLDTAVEQKLSEADFVQKFIQKLKKRLDDR